MVTTVILAKAKILANTPEMLCMHTFPNFFNLYPTKDPYAGLLNSSAYPTKYPYPGLCALQCCSVTHTLGFVHSSAVVYHSAKLTAQYVQLSCT
jgi:hypothetical protein